MHVRSGRSVRDWCVWIYEAGVPFFITAIIIFFFYYCNLFKIFSIKVVSQLVYVLAKYINA